MRAVFDAWREVSLRELLEVKARAKRGSLPGEYDGADDRIPCPAIKLFGDLVAELDRTALRRSGRRVSVATPSSATSVAISGSSLLQAQMYRLIL